MEISAVLTSKSGTSVSEKVSFTVYLIELISQPLVAMEHSVGKAVSNQAITGWTFDPLVGNVLLYSFQYTIEERSGGTVPTWISINSSNEIEIDDSALNTATDLGKFEL